MGVPSSWGHTQLFAYHRDVNPRLEKTLRFGSPVEGRGGSDDFFQLKCESAKVNLVRITNLFIYREILLENRETLRQGKKPGDSREIRES